MSMEKVKDANSNFQFKDKYFQSLVEKNAPYFKEEQRATLWNFNVYQSLCEVFAPNWKKVSNCIAAHTVCETYLPLYNDTYEFKVYEAYKIYVEAVSEKKYPKYNECIEDSISIKWTMREYILTAWKIFIAIPLVFLGAVSYSIFAFDLINFLNISL